MHERASLDKPRGSSAPSLATTSCSPPPASSVTSAANRSSGCWYIVNAPLVSASLPNAFCTLTELAPSKPGDGVAHVIVLSSTTTTLLAADAPKAAVVLTAFSNSSAEPVMIACCGALANALDGDTPVIDGGPLHEQDVDGCGPSVGVSTSRLSGAAASATSIVKVGPDAGPLKLRPQLDAALAATCPRARRRLGPWP